jgi:transposase InsO family protein
MKDLCTKKIVGWSMSIWNNAELVLKAVQMAWSRQNPATGLVVHSDQGTQYSSDAFRETLEQLHIVRSMSRRGNCYDNAPMESFFSSLKSERLEHEHFFTPRRRSGRGHLIYRNILQPSTPTLEHRV